MSWDKLLESNPLLWVLFTSLFGPPALMSKTAARIPGFLGWAGRKWQARADQSPDERRVSASFRTSQEEIARIEGNYARLLEDHNELVVRVDKIDEELSREKRIRWAAIGYIRVLIDALRKHAPDADVPDPPPLLADIL